MSQHHLCDPLYAEARAVEAMKILLNIIRTSEDKEIQGSKATVERIAVIVAFIIPHPAIVHSLHILFTARAFTLRQVLLTPVS